MQADCDYRYCSQDLVVKGPGSLHESIIFLSSSINTKIRTGEIPKCGKVLVEGHHAIPVCSIGDPAYPLLPFLMKEYPGRRGKNKENNISATNYQVPELPLRMLLAG